MTEEFVPCNRREQALLEVLDRGGREKYISLRHGGATVLDAAAGVDITLEMWQRVLKDCGMLYKLTRPFRMQVRDASGYAVERSTGKSGLGTFAHEVEVFRLTDPEGAASVFVRGSGKCDTEVFPAVILSGDIVVQDWPTILVRGVKAGFNDRFDRRQRDD